MSSRLVTIQWSLATQICTLLLFKVSTVAHFIIIVINTILFFVLFKHYMATTEVIEEIITKKGVNEALLWVLV